MVKLSTAMLRHLAFIDRVLERFAGRKLGLLRGRDVDGRAGLRIASYPRGALGHPESPKTGQPNFAPLLQGGSDDVENSIDGLVGVGLGETGAVGDGSGKILFVHRE